MKNEKQIFLNKHKPAFNRQISDKKSNMSKHI